MFFRCRAFVFVFVAFSVCLVLSRAQGAGKREGPLVVQAGKIDGKVVDAVGDAVPRSDVKIVNPAGKTVKEVKTNPEGHFNLKLREGEYLVRIGEERTFDLRVTETTSVRELAFVLPVNKTLSPLNLEFGHLFDWATSKSGFLGLSTAGLVATGGGLSLATAAVTVSGGGGGGGGSDADLNQSVSP